MEKLSLIEREVISKNWLEIKEIIEEKNNFHFNFANNINIMAINKDKFILVIILKKPNIRIRINKNAKYIKFKYNIKDKEGDKEETKEELIYEPKSIIFFINYFKMKHPCFIKENNIKILVDEPIIEEIYHSSNINEIFDDQLKSYIDENDYFYYKNKIEEKVSDYYYKFSLNLYSKIISEDKEINNNDRYNFGDFVSNLYKFNENIIFVIGCQKIGLSFTILQNLKYLNILYINFEELYHLNKNSDKKKYIFMKFFNIFDKYKDYEDFIDNNIFKISGYNNILQVIKSIITCISDNFKAKEYDHMYIILDNYDDHLVGETKLSQDYIEDLYKIIYHKNINIRKRLIYK